MSAIESRRSDGTLRRLQILLLLMLLWDLVAVLAALSFGSTLMRIEGDEVGGILAARVSFSGAALVPMGVYFYGMVRNPLRHPGVLWVGIIEQAAAAILSIYHVVGGDIEPEGAVLTVVVSVVLLALLLVNMPRGDAHARA
jgi:hypothetical protein